LHLRLCICLLVLGSVLSGCGPKRGGQASTNAKPIAGTLTFTVVPYDTAVKLSEDYGPMATYLAKKIGVAQGHFFPVADYAGVIAALRSGQVDVAYLSSFPYALASGRMHLTPLAMPWVRGDLMYHGIVFVRRESPIHTIDDLKGRTFAFGDPGSTSGYLLPRRLLETHGIPLSALKRYYNAGDANAVVAAVENGTADAGAAYNLVFEVAYKEHPEKTSQMRVVARTEDIPNGIYVAREGLPAAQIDALKQAFQDMNTDPDGRAAMLKAPNDKVVPPDDRLFNGVRETAMADGIDVSSLDKK
jgi:phosphonate transport system substrate-binding protein